MRRPRQHQPQSRVIYKWELKRTPLLLPTVLLSESLPHPPLRLPNVHRHSSNKHTPVWRPSLGPAGPCTTRHGRWGARPHAAGRLGSAAGPQPARLLGIVHLNQLRLKDGVSASCFPFKRTLAVLTGLHSPVVAEMLASKVSRPPTMRDTANREDVAQRKGKPAVNATARWCHAEMIFGHLGLNSTLLAPRFLFLRSRAGPTRALRCLPRGRGVPRPLPVDTGRSQPGRCWTLARPGPQGVPPAADRGGRQSVICRAARAGGPGRGWSPSARPWAGRVRLPQRTSVFSAWVFLPPHPLPRQDTVCAASPRPGGRIVGHALRPSSTYFNMHVL